MGAGLLARSGGGGLVSDVPPPSSSPFQGLGTQAQLQTVRTKLREAQSKLIQQESALKELSERGEGGTLP